MHADIYESECLYKRRSHCRKKTFYVSKWCFTSHHKSVTLWESYFVCSAVWPIHEWTCLPVNCSLSLVMHNELLVLFSSASFWRLPWSAVTSWCLLWSAKTSWFLSWSALLSWCLLSSIVEDFVSCFYSKPVGSKIRLLIFYCHWLKHAVFWITWFVYNCICESLIFPPKLVPVCL